MMELNSLGRSARSARHKGANKTFCDPSWVGWQVAALYQHHYRQGSTISNADWHTALAQLDLASLTDAYISSTELLEAQ